MSLTLFGLLVAGAGLIMLIFKRPLRDFLAALLVASVLGSAEAIALPALGGASLAVPYFFVLFVILRMFLMSFKNASLFQEALVANIWLVLFAIYGVVAAMIFPRLFEGVIDVISMRPMPYKTPLTFSSQNITQSTYMCLTALTSLAGYSAARMTKSDEGLTNGWLIATGFYLAFALVDLVGFYAGFGGVMDWARTASYAMVAQSESGIRRISGSFSEPSSFSAFGAAPLLFFAWRWVMNLGASTSGILAIALAVALAASTSSTAYALLAIVLFTILLGVFFVPMKSSVRRQKFLSLGGLIIFALLAVFLFAAINPEFVATFADVVQKMTVGKVNSASAIERGQWAAQGFLAFNVSHGLGVGPGSFRSSGLVPAVWGSTGLVGAFFLSMHMAQLFFASFRKNGFSSERIAAAATITALVMLTPQMVSGASPDVGILFGAMSGFALGRHRKAKLRAAEPLEEFAPEAAETASPAGLPRLES